MADFNQNLGNIMKEAQKLQEKMQDAQAEILKIEVEGVAGGGMVKIKRNGQNVLSIDIHSSLYDDPEMLKDLIVAAFNDSNRKMEAASRDRITKLTAGLNLPTDFLKKSDE